MADAITKSVLYEIGRMSNVQGVPAHMFMQRLQNVHEMAQSELHRLEHGTFPALGEDTTIDDETLWGGGEG